MEKLRNNPYGYELYILWILKFKRLFESIFLSHIEKILSSLLSWSILKKNVSYPTLKKHDFLLMNIEYIY
jgi:hypothetical protein